MGGAEGGRDHLIISFFAVIIKLPHLKTWKWLQSIGFQQCKSSKVFFLLFFEIKFDSRESRYSSQPQFGEKGYKNCAQFASWGFKVAESRNGSMWMISWVAVCEQTAGSWSPLAGTLLHMSRLLGSSQNSLSRLLWSQENLPETWVWVSTGACSGANCTWRLSECTPQHVQVWRVSAQVWEHVRVGALAVSLCDAFAWMEREKNLLWLCLLLTMKTMSVIHWFIVSDILIYS